MRMFISCFINGFTWSFNGLEKMQYREKKVCNKKESSRS